MTFFYIWEDARVWAHWNHSFGMHFSYLGSGYYFPSSWIPPECNVCVWGGSVSSWWPRHPLFTDMAGGIFNAHHSPAHITGQWILGPCINASWVRQEQFSTALPSSSSRFQYKAVSQGLALGRSARAPYIFIKTKINRSSLMSGLHGLVWRASEKKLLSAVPQIPSLVVCWFY